MHVAILEAFITPFKMHSKLFNTVNSVHRAYETTKLYRELKMRGAIVDESYNLKLLPLEQLVDKVNGVWNLSTDQVGRSSLFRNVFYKDYGL